MPVPVNVKLLFVPVTPPLNVNVPLPDALIVPPLPVKLITRLLVCPEPVYCNVPEGPISIVPFATVVGLPIELLPPLTLNIVLIARIPALIIVLPEY